MMRNGKVSGCAVLAAAVLAAWGSPAARAEEPLRTDPVVVTATRIPERLDLVRGNLDGMPHVAVTTFDGLLVDLARREGAVALVRGVRTYQDWEYELRMVQMNRHLAPGLETVFMMPAEQYTYISSRLIKEVFMLGGAIDGLVPAVVEERLHQKRNRT